MRTQGICGYDHWKTYFDLASTFQLELEVKNEESQKMKRPFLT